MTGIFKRWIEIALASSVALVIIALSVVFNSQPVEAVVYPNSTNCATIGSSYGVTGYNGGAVYGCSAPKPVINAKNSDGVLTTPLETQVESLLYYRAIGSCLKSGNFISSYDGNYYGQLEESDASSNNWFRYGNAFPNLGLPYFKGSYGITDKSGAIDCYSDGMNGLMQQAKTLWSLQYDNWLCAAGWTRTDVVDDLKANPADAITAKNLLDASKRCTNEDSAGSGSFSFFAERTAIETSIDSNGVEHTGAVTKGYDLLPGKLSTDRVNFPYESANSVADKLLTIIRERAYGGETPDIGNAAKYELYRSVFFNTCSSNSDWSGGSKTAPATKLPKDFSARIISVSDDGKTTTDEVRWFTYASGYSDSKSVNVMPQGWSENFAMLTKTCKSLLDDMAGAMGTAFKTDVDYRIAHGTPVDPDPNAGVVNTAESSCSIPGIGWIICPVFNLLAGITDGVYKIIDQLLKTDVGIFDSNSGTRNAWVAMRDIANVGLVIAFLIIIFSQMSSIGITNYGVKKLLPRLVIAALLINLSYYVCQIAVDISNILGGSLKGFLDSLPIFSAAKSVFDKTTWITDLTTSILAGQLVAGTVAAGIVVTALTGVGLLVPILLGAFVALVVMYFILVARQALVILLIVVAPLAFLAMLLPNTENYFKQWRKVFIALLLVYPMVALLFGGSRLASGVLLNSLGTDLFGKLAALAVLIIPLFVLPGIIKNSLNAIPAIGNLASKLQTRANSRLGAKAKEFGSATPIARGMALRKQARANYRDRKFAEGMSKKGSITSGLARGLLRPDLLPPGSKLGKAAGKVMGASLESQKALTRSASGAAEKEEMADIGYAQQEITQGSLDAAAENGPEAAFAYAQQQLEQAIEEGDTVKAKAAFTSLHKMGQTGVVRATESMARLHAKHGYSSDMRSLGRYMRAAHPDIKQSDNRLNKWTEGDASGLMATASNSSTHLDGLRDGEIATQSGASIRTGQLDAAVAARILNDVNLQKEFKPDTRTALIEKAGDLYIPPTGDQGQGDGTQPIPAADDDHPTLF